MKYTVIGWTEYDNDRIETGENDDEAVEAIIADIRANGYCFSGWAHQELHCGAPVLSDQKKRLFSQPFYFYNQLTIVRSVSLSKM